MAGEGFERVSTGIDGLDEVLHGGIPWGNLTLVSGPPGSGKSTLGAQFLVHGAAEGETGVYIGIGEEEDRITKNLKAFDWEIEDHLEEDRIAVISPPMYDYKKLVNKVNRTVRDLDADRVLLDSITVIKSFFEHEFEVRKKIMGLRQTINEMDVTTVTTSESRRAEESSHIGVEEYVADGVIEMFYEEEEKGYQRYLVVKKMRGTEHSMERFPITINSEGVSLER
ncbi:MAG: ATPase domain-containing protein [Candidatus Nanohaloarchaea archaeon]|nr:ATPase domain-containing protein [Candidatus Nanohaloarchaea archaeon]